MLVLCAHLGKGEGRERAVDKLGMEQTVVSEALFALFTQAHDPFAPPERLDFPVRGQEAQRTDEGGWSEVWLGQSGGVKAADEFGAVGGVAGPCAGTLGKACGIDSGFTAEGGNFQTGVVGHYDAVGG